MTETKGYAGDVTPTEAWEMLTENPDTVLVDVRTNAEWSFVGVPDTSNLGRTPVLAQWNTATGRNPDFLTELTAAGITADTPVLFLCRSGQRSISAAQAATAAGLGPAYNITEGFEGPLDAAGHRGHAGWRALGLPWKQS